MLTASATRLFADHIDARLLDDARRDGWSPALWRSVEESQLPLISIAEAVGGAGGSLSDWAAVLRLAGRFAAPIPLAETGIAGWMLADSRLPLPREACPVCRSTLKQRASARADGGCREACGACHGASRNIWSCSRPVRWRNCRVRRSGSLKSRPD
jgi:acyl-CoA dehydrogenase